MGYNKHLAKISSAGHVIRVGKINLLRARGERGGRGERAETAEREDKGYNTHLAKISSSGQGLCNCSVRVTRMSLGPDLMKLSSTK